jgi:hypothetical protein
MFCNLSALPSAIAASRKAFFTCHETASSAPPIEGALADPVPGDFSERLHDGSCIHASLKARPLPIIALDNSLALAERSGVGHVRYRTAPKSFFG